MPCVDVSIDSIQVKSGLDTGAAVSLSSFDLYTKYKHTESVDVLKPCELNLVCASREMMKVAGITSLKFIMGNKTMTQTMVVAEALFVDMILRNDFLAMTAESMNFADSCLKKLKMETKSHFQLERTQ